MYMEHWNWNRWLKDLACSVEDRGVGEGQDWIDPPEGWCRYGPPPDVLPPRKGGGLILLDLIFQ